ncbi:MAG TPA: class E sortase [Pseudonocardiaceae bacterium]|nr:class E sortase [Pseudonocardiaceae bacterium]
MTTRWELRAGGFRRHSLASTRQRLWVGRTERLDSAPALEGEHRVDQRPAQRVQRPQPPLAGALPPRSSPEYRLAGQVLVIVAVMALFFLMELTVLGDLRHARDQAQLAAQFRVELAKGIAPVGPFDDANTALALGAPVALLEIPRLGLREVVVEGTSSGQLMSAPGHRRDTPLPGQVGTSVVAGRRATYGKPFRSIDQLCANDQITVTTGWGKHSFTVLGLRRAGDPVPPPLSSGQGRLTLVTTSGPALRPTDVLRVDAALLGAAESRPAQLSSQALRPAEALMAGDSSALQGVFGWSALLAATALATVWFRFRAGLWPAWALGVPVLVALGLTVSDELTALLPNLL